MLYTYDHACLSSTLQNTSGRRMTFSFLPPHGRVLDPDELIDIVGTVEEAIARSAHGNSSKRKIAAYLRALDDGLLALVATPSPMLVDETSGASKILTLRGGTFHTADPCYETSLSDS